MPSQNDLRRAAFAALLKRSGDSPGDYDEGEEEDPRPYISGKKQLGRFVCVTKNWSNSAGKSFYLPTFGDWESARARAEAYDTDDIFEEIPVAIVDLDTGADWYAEPHYAWRTGNEPRYSSSVRKES